MSNPQKKEHVMEEIDELRQQAEKYKALERRYKQSEDELRAYRERDELLIESAPLAIFTVDLQGNVTAINRRMRELFSWSSDIQPNAQKLIDCPGISASGICSDINQCISHKQPIIAERSYNNNPGEDTLELRYYLSPVVSNQGSVNGIMGIVEDSTDLKRAEEALKESERRYRQLFQSAPIALIEWDVSRLKRYLDELRDSGVVDFRNYFDQHPQEIHHCWNLIKTADFNHAFLDLMGIPRTVIPDGAFLPTDAEEFLVMAREVILVAAEGKTAVEREETIVTTSGEIKIVLGKSLVVTGHEDTMERVAIAMLDISQRKKAEAALRESERRFREQAFRDGLTGLYNQRYLYQSLKNWIDHANTTETPISLLFIDLDHFKNIVDTYGHLNGSRAIQKVAQTIESCLEEPAYAVAYAGDEFVVVLPEMDQEKALAKASDIHCRVRDTFYRLDHDIEVRLTASFGMATFPQHATDLHGLIAAADQALFAIKGTGKDAIGQYSDITGEQNYNMNSSIKQ